MNNLKEILLIVAKITNNKLENINEQSSFKNTENWDSINHVKILLECEMKFNKRIDTELFTELNNISKIKDFIDGK
jgi:acyl carrier protein